MAKVDIDFIMFQSFFREYNIKQEKQDKNGTNSLISVLLRNLYSWGKNWKKL